MSISENELEAIRAANEREERERYQQMAKLHPKARAVIRRVVAFEYELHYQDYTDYTIEQAMAEEKKSAQYSTWFRNTNFEITDDKFEVLWSIPDDEYLVLEDDDASQEV